MAWGDYLSESFADKLDDAGKVLLIVAAVIGTIGFFSGFTPLLAGAAVSGLVGIVVPPVYGLLESVAGNAAASQPDETLAAVPGQVQATIGNLRPQPEAGCESSRYQELEALRQEVAAFYRNL
jgi:hypothetical protein